MASYSVIVMQVQMRRSCVRFAWLWALWPSREVLPGFCSLLRQRAWLSYRALRLLRDAGDGDEDNGLHV